MMRFTDEWFASIADDFKSQLGFVIAIVEADNRVSVLVMRREGGAVTRSVLASERFALVEGFDTAAAIADQLSEILRINVPVWLLLVPVRCSPLLREWGMCRKTVS
jgi:hypothetical protein